MAAPPTSPSSKPLSPCTCPSPTPAGTLVVRHAHGSLARADDFRPIEDHVAKGLSNELASSSGDSSSGDSLPFFNVQLGTGGVVEAIGWPGNWKAGFTSAADGKTATLTADMQRTHLVLHPGEEIRTPRIVLMPWNGSETTVTETGTNWQDAQNTWRRLLLAHYSPRQNGKSMPGPMSCSCGLPRVARMISAGTTTG